jgi:hypothetical protein
MKTGLVTNVRDPADETMVRDLLLNALAVSSGAIDAISFLALGKVFSAFMTGNIAFLGLRVAGALRPGSSPSSLRWSHSQWEFTSRH